MDGTRADGTGMGASRIISISWRSVCAAKRRSPVSISWSITPTEKRSLRPSSGSPRTCSGDMYPVVPFTTPTCVCPRPSRALAMPKSSSFTTPSYVTITFFCATSRWMTG